MNLQQLQHLLAVAETGSFSLAAEKVHLTQPALSRSIQALEEEIGGPLIERSLKVKELTPLGVVVAARARRIGLEISEVKRSAALLSEGGTVRLGLGPAPAAMLSAPLLRHVMEGHPRVRILLSGGPAERQLQALRERTVDALVLHRDGVPPQADLRITLFPKMRLAFVCSKRHPLAQSAAVSAEALWSYPIAAGGVGLRNETVHRLAEHFGQSLDFGEAVQLHSDELSCLVETVRNSHAIFFGVREVARSLLDAGELVELQLAAPIDFSSEFAYVTLAGLTEPPALKVVREFCEMRMRDQ
ncbi:LysR family transcriptional regulator [Variovorax rhizosphaerae]|uniref:LysR family transcriptional regulator n=1 Tax=Variovorax rhizosphaerae TaxID=1836200 RepID=A0ABU8WXA8_9BURK